MNRALYRLYLYVVAVVMLVFAAISLRSLLNTLLSETPLRDLYAAAPDSRAVVQSSVLAATALLVALGIGGLHYWLIRRDLAGDPSAGGGAVRALALNFTQTTAALFAFFAGLTLLSSVGQPYAFGRNGYLATLLVAAAVFALAQWERARTQAGPGAPLVLQRLHLYGVQTVILIAAIFTVMTAVETSIQVLLIQARAVPDPCAGIFTPPGEPPDLFVCNIAAGLLGKWLALVWVVGAWALYAWLARADRRSVLRQIAYYFGFVAGLASLIFGVDRAVEWLLRAALGASGGLAVEYVDSYAFAGIVLFGVLVMLFYARRLDRDSAGEARSAQTTQLTLLALGAVALGFPLYIGIVRLGHGLVEAALRGDQLAAAGWASALALIVAGLAHPLLAYLLRARSVGDAPSGPHRAYIFAGLAAGALTAALSLATALYLTITGLLGTPVSANWAADARYAVVTLLVGGFIGGIHLWRFLQLRSVERAAGAQPAGGQVAATAGAAAGVSAGDGTIEAVLDALLAGQVSREQAAAQLHALIASR